MRGPNRFIAFRLKYDLFMRLIIACVTTVLLIACRDVEPIIPTPQPPQPKERIDVLALGDSYTKAQGVAAEQSFPLQLADSLRVLGQDVTGVRIIAQTGWRTDQLIAAVNAATELADSTFSLVTLCIGVNNQFQNRDIEVYRGEFEALLQTALARAGGRKERVLVLSIPDWYYTSFGQNYPSSSNISAKIDEFNAVNRNVTEAAGIAYINVTPVSRQGVAQPNLVAADQLHPSALQYSRWVSLMLPKVREVLKI
jgi:lysophospholipase L1-like esterase